MIRPRFNNAVVRAGVICSAALLLVLVYALWPTFHRASAFGSTNSIPTQLRAKLLLSDEGAVKREIRFLQTRVREDPEDIRAQNRLAGHYLQRVRETNDLTYLKLATVAARASLAAVPASRNSGGLTALAQAEYAVHEFTGARDDALQLLELDPGSSEAYALLGDALLELGEYSKAREAFQQMSRLGGTSAGVEIRLGRFSLLQGETQTARKHFLTGLALALNSPTPPRETVAWCRWQLGETAFSTGDYETAERHYQDALTTFPGYLNALGSLGKVRAARGDLQGAIQKYEQAIQRVPDPIFEAALGDLYHLLGRENESKERYELVEAIGRLAVVNGGKFNRNLVLFHADHNLKVEETYEAAVQEYATRRDIYGADALAWAALKAGRIKEAQVAMRDALRLGTHDAKLFYHAELIAHAAGDQAGARSNLDRVLGLNPRFDPMQAEVATSALGR